MRPTFRTETSSSATESLFESLVLRLLLAAQLAIALNIKKNPIRGSSDFHIELGQRFEIE